MESCNPLSSGVSKAFAHFSPLYSENRMFFSIRSGGPRVEIIGKGSVEEVIPGKVYRIRHCLGKDPATGKYRRSKKKTVYCTKRQVWNELAIYKEELLQEEYERTHPTRAMPNIEEYGKEFIEVKETTQELALSTIQSYKASARLVNSLFGSIRLDELNAGIINRRCTAFVKKEGATVNQIYRIKKFLKSIYRQAVLEGLIDYRDNPCLVIDTRRPKVKTRNSLSIEEFARLHQILIDMPRTSRLAGVFIGMKTGMRKGEVLGLTWANVDFKNKKIHVAQQLDDYGQFKEPKSRAGFRLISIDDETVDYLLDWKSIQKQELASYGKNQFDSTVVCTNDWNGGVFDSRGYSRWFRDFCVEHGFGKYLDTSDYKDNQGKKDGWHRKRKSEYVGLCFHELRHTQATLLIAAGVDVKTVQHRLGHSEVSTTLDIYAHAIDANDELATSALNSYLTSKEMK